MTGLEILRRMERQVWINLRASLVAQGIKNLPTMQEDPLEKGMATHSSILAWRIPWTEEETTRLQFMGLQRGGHH